MKQKIFFDQNGNRLLSRKKMHRFAPEKEQMNRYTWRARKKEPEPIEALRMPRSENFQRPIRRELWYVRAWQKVKKVFRGQSE